MSIEGDTAGTTRFVTPPTAPSSVVWSGGHSYVLEGDHRSPRWVGLDDRGRPIALSHAELQRRGWTRTKH